MGARFADTWRQPLRHVPTHVLPTGVGLQLKDVPSGAEGLGAVQAASRQRHTHTQVAYSVNCKRERWRVVEVWCLVSGALIPHTLPSPFGAPGGAARRASGAAMPECVALTPVARASDGAPLAVPAGGRHAANTALLAACHAGASRSPVGTGWCVGGESADLKRLGTHWVGGSQQQAGRQVGQQGQNTLRVCVWYHCACGCAAVGFMRLFAGSMLLGATQQNQELQTTSVAAVQWHPLASSLYRT